jgi:hypothetical protein
MLIDTLVYSSTQVYYVHTVFLANTIHHLTILTYNLAYYSTHVQCIPTKFFVPPL